MAASSYVPPVGMKMTAFDFSKAVILGRDTLCCTTAFFFYRRTSFIKNFCLQEQAYTAIAYPY